ncbi:response regulator FixJ [Legionella massiliensis]|uniref:Response regulator FixJ n=1 Tax=Legionella massiliensis TaxID=1034943 RepID=A0A078KTW5_9GAMM|nr:helix-turn-helix transcriptional regulator [Legionella massiliensis]CDZ76476.1 response regulator FixJ [Legionella massiliensis]CEE12214.1 response regulator FixJ [Legionella massiliensis]
MSFNNLQDTSSELIMKPVGSGIQLIHPDSVNQDKDEQRIISPYSVADFLKLPSSVYFVNKYHAIENLNQMAVDACKYESIKQALGRGEADHTLSEDSFHQLMVDQKRTMQTETMQIFNNEVCLQDESFFRCLVVLKPWYDLHYKVAGVIGVTVVVDEHSLAETLTALTKNEFLNYGTKAVKNRALPNTINGVPLSPRETDCVQYYVKGKTAKEIAKYLNLSPRTVEFYISNLKEKLGVSTKSQLMELLIT